MRTVAVSEAMRSFAALLRAAESGEEIIITRGGKPIARLAGVAKGVQQPSAGAAKPRLRSLGWRDHP
jgi:prevent-host-death family protein